jgi:hypothetical protein
MDTKTSPRAPRINVQLSPQSLALVVRLSDLTGQPRAALVAELVDAALPALVSGVEALEHAKAGRVDQAERLLSRFAHQATADLAQQQLDLQREVDGRTVEGKRAKRRASGGRVST